MSSDEEDHDCPLCMEEIDFSDRHFKPCPCGYRICRFCWNHIKENLNKRCPACRREYNEASVEYRAPSQAELQKHRSDKKQREKERKEMEANNRRHLANMRVVQKNLVYVIGLSARVANEDLLRQWEYFGQYGRIIKIVVNRRNMANFPVARVEPSVGVYVTFARKEDAAQCIQAIDGTVLEGRVLRASYGTTKYCTYYLRGLVCQNPGCMYLHEPGEDADSYTKEEMAAGKHHAKIHPSNPPVGSTSQSSVAINENGYAVGPATPFGHNAPERAPGTPANLSLDEPAATPSKRASIVAVSDGQQQQQQQHDEVMGSPASSALPRKAAWAKFPASSSNVANSGIECSLFEDIDPRSTQPSRKPTPSTLINTASLHRYLFLAHQAREYYLQLSAQVLGSSGTHADMAAMLFDPFKDQASSTGSAAAKSGTLDGITKSRYGFAQSSSASGSVSNLTSQLDSVSLHSSSDRLAQPSNQQQQHQQAQRFADWNQQQQQQSQQPSQVQQQQQQMDTWSGNTAEYRPPGFMQQQQMGRGGPASRMW